MALGYSNGANIAAAMLLLRPEVFARAVLLRPMLPLQAPPVTGLHGKEILILKGEYDTVIPPESTEHLIRVFQDLGASVTVREVASGHEITDQDLEEISHWLSETYVQTEQGHARKITV